MTLQEAGRYITERLGPIRILLDEHTTELSREDCDTIIKTIRKDREKRK